MKRIISLGMVVLVMIALVSNLTGCTPKNQKTYPDYSETVNEELGCAELTYDGVTYRPFGVLINTKLRGTQIGIRENNPDLKIHEIKGYSSSEWIIEHHTVLMGGISIWKAVGVTDIPSELEQHRQYDY
jgi:hypothetical protein